MLRASWVKKGDQLGQRYVVPLRRVSITDCIKSADYDVLRDLSAQDGVVEVVQFSAAHQPQGESNHMPILSLNLSHHVLRASVSLPTCAQ